MQKIKYPTILFCLFIFFSCDFLQWISGFKRLHAVRPSEKGIPLIVTRWGFQIALMALYDKQDSDNKTAQVCMCLSIYLSQN